MDQVEAIRREQAQAINREPSEREVLEAKHGQVWTTDELREEFEVVGFASPLVVARRKSDGKLGSLYFQHSPRYYFGFQPHEG